MYERENGLISLIAAFAVGGLVGAGIALLMAPQSGQETRSQIRDKGIAIKDKAVGTAEETKARAEKAIDDLANQTKDRVASMTHQGKEMIENEKAQLQEKIKNAKESAAY